MRHILLGLLAAAWLSAADTPVSLMDQGHHKRLRALAEQRHREHPNDPEALWMMSFVKLAWGDHKSALDLAEKAVAGDPRNPRYHLALAQAVGLEAQKASVLRQPGLARRFKKELEATLAIDPKNIEAMKLLIRYDFEAPGIMGGDKAKGRATAQEIARIDPVEGYLVQVTLARYDHEEGRGEELIRKAVEAGPGSYSAHLNLANACLGASRKYAEAEAQSRETIRIDPTRAGGHSTLVAALVMEDRWAALDAALVQAEKDVPDDLTPYYRAAMTCFGRSIELPRAEGYLRKYLTIEPEPYATNWSRVHWRLGQLVEKQGRKADAIAEFQAAVKLDPESPAKQDLKRLK